MGLLGEVAGLPPEAGASLKNPNTRAASEAADAMPGMTPFGPPPAISSATVTSKIPNKMTTSRTGHASQRCQDNCRNETAGSRLGRGLPALPFQRG